MHACTSQYIPNDDFSIYTKFANNNNDDDRNNDSNSNYK